MSCLKIEVSLPEHHKLALKLSCVACEAMTVLAISKRAWNCDLQGAYKPCGSYVG